MENASTEWKRGWHVVLGAFLGLGSGPLIYQYISSIFMLELIQEFGWSRSQVSSIMAVVVLGVVTAPITGYLVDRFGVRPAIIVGTIGVSGGYMLFATLPPGLGSYRFAMAVLTVFGVACSALAYSRVVSVWFDKQRGTALAIAATGVAVTALVMPLILRQLVDAEGWRAGYVMLSILVLTGGLPAIALMFARPQPEATTPQRLNVAAREPWRAMFRQPAFWLIFMAMIFVHIPAVGMLSHFAPLMVSYGFDNDEAALLLSFYGLSVLIGRVFAGYFLDRHNPYKVAFAVTLGGAVGALVLIAAPNHSFALAICVTVLLGVQMGAELDLLPFFVARHMNMRNYASVYGIMTAAILMSGGAAALLFGVLFDLSGDYTIALLVGAGSFVTGALSFLMLRRLPPAKQVKAFDDEFAVVGGHAVS